MFAVVARAIAQLSVNVRIVVILLQLRFKRQMRSLIQERRQKRNWKKLQEMRNLEQAMKILILIPNIEK